MRAILRCGLCIYLWARSRVALSNATAEKHLLAAVLLRAVRDLVSHAPGNGSADPRVAEAARRWIFDSGEDDHYLTSFGGICQALSLDCGKVRERIQMLCPEEVERRSAVGFWLRMR